MNENALRVPNTPDDILKYFNEGHMTINIKGASTEDLKQLKKITALRRWRSGDDFDDPGMFYYTDFNSYVLCTLNANGIGVATRSDNPYKDFSMSIHQFLDLFGSEIKNIEEYEIEEIFNE